MGSDLQLDIVVAFLEKDRKGLVVVEELLVEIKKHDLADSEVIEYQELLLDHVQQLVRSCDGGRTGKVPKTHVEAIYDQVDLE